MLLLYNNQNILSLYIIVNVIAYNFAYDDGNGGAFNEIMGQK
jgi:hypothetical protein